MPSDEELFELRVTLLGQRGALATHSPAATIVDHRRSSEPERDPGEAGGVPLARAPDLALVRTIGEGGMGRVHLARQHSLDRDVAVKTLKENATALASVGLLREARLAGSLEHPGVIPVHALGVDDAGVRRPEPFAVVGLGDDDQRSSRREPGDPLAGLPHRGVFA